LTRNDPANEVDVVPVYVAWLKNPASMPPGVAASLARNGQLPPRMVQVRGLQRTTSTPILAATLLPLVRPILIPRASIYGRDFSYAPPSEWRPTHTQQFTLNYDTTSKQGHQTTDEHKTTYSVDVSVSILGFLNAIWTDTHTFVLLTRSRKPTLKLQARRPVFPSWGLIPDIRSTDVRVYKDNIYGTFMFAFVPWRRRDFSCL